MVTVIQLKEGCSWVNKNLYVFFLCYAVLCGDAYADAPWRTVNARQSSNDYKGTVASCTARDGQGTSDNEVLSSKDSSGKAFHFRCERGACGDGQYVVTVNEACINNGGVCKENFGFECTLAVFDDAWRVARDYNKKTVEIGVCKQAGADYFIKKIGYSHKVLVYENRVYQDYIVLQSGSYRVCYAYQCDNGYLLNSDKSACVQRVCADNATETSDNCDGVANATRCTRKCVGGVAWQLQSVNECATGFKPEGEKCVALPKEPAKKNQDSKKQKKPTLQNDKGQEQVVAQLQNYNLSGLVIDNRKKVLSGATIATLDSKWSIVTDSDGKFNGNIKTSADTKVEVSFVGCTSQQFSVTELTNRTVQLQCLEEVVCPADKENGILARTLIDGECYPSECVVPGWKLEGTGKDAKCVPGAQETVVKEMQPETEGEKQEKTVEEDSVNQEIDEEQPEGKSDLCAGKEGFEVVDGICVEIGGDCEVLPENATRAYRKYDAESKTVVCIVDECANGYKISQNQQVCEEDLEAKARAAREKEQSTENKLLGAAGMAAGGIGGMQLASGLAEKNADAAAERDMAAYLATFRCDYGSGKNIQGGETGVELPAINILKQKTEYVALANDLKIRKDALGIKPGIEAEVIKDAATMGLYDNVAIGKTDGAFASVARALQDEKGQDAEDWNQQKADAQQKIKTGAIVGGAGIGATAVADVIMN